MMEDNIKFVTDLCPLMKMVKSCSLSMCGFPETWSVEIMVKEIFESLLSILIDLHQKGYFLEIRPVTDHISIVVRHPDYIPF